MICFSLTAFITTGATELCMTFHCWRNPLVWNTCRPICLHRRSYRKSARLPCDVHQPAYSCYALSMVLCEQNILRELMYHCARGCLWKKHYVLAWPGSIPHTLNEICIWLFLHLSWQVHIPLAIRESTFLCSLKGCHSIAPWITQSVALFEGICGWHVGKRGKNLSEPSWKSWMRTGQSWNYLGYHIAFLWSSVAHAHPIWGTSLDVVSKQDFFYSILHMEYSAQGSMKTPLRKWYFQVSQIICSMSVTPWLNTKSRKGQMVNMPFT